MRRWGGPDSWELRGSHGQASRVMSVFACRESDARLSLARPEQNDQANICTIQPHRANNEILWS